MKKIIAILSIAVAWADARAHHGYRECMHGYDCLAAAAKRIDAGDLAEARNYLRPAMERNCGIIYDVGPHLKYVSPEIQPGEIAQRDCSKTMREYCRLLRAEQGDMVALSCLYGRSGGPAWAANMKPLAESILADLGITFSEYLDRDRVDWAREVQRPMVEDMYGIKD
ncbi:MAG: hypothetical protein LBL46_03270 [Rickettsiales bacterium]|nr:hypothetical protein [Rickettsiales bacterium]